MASPHTFVRAGCPAHAKEGQAGADAARERSAEHQRMAERHVEKADRHVETQRRLVEKLVRDRRLNILGHARRVLEILERSQQLARNHRALEREFLGNLR